MGVAVGTGATAVTAGTVAGAMAGAVGEGVSTGALCAMSHGEDEVWGVVDWEARTKQFA